jgi:GcrA cell cycle regulator
MLTSMWADGKSASEIAHAIGQGLTRSAVIGKVHRLKLPERPKRVHEKPKTANHLRATSRQIRQPEQQFTDDACNPKNKLQSPDVDESEGVDVTERIGMLDLKSDSCRFPFGDPKAADFGFCGKPVKPGTSWCPAHHARVFVGKANLY